jgi:sensor histidine kinase regulating citrate/malate metabolism
MEVFNTVTENLLDNARSKRLIQPDLSITVILQADNSSIDLRVMDNGSPVPDQTAAQLFEEVLFSENGFGIGLYQSSQLARRAGYRLTLEHNNPGNVCFRLSNN